MNIIYNIKDIERFLFIRGFNPANTRTRIFACVIYFILEDMEGTKISRKSPVQRVAEMFDTNSNNIIQHLFRCKKDVEDLQNRVIDLSPTQIAYALSYEYLSIKK